MHATRLTEQPHRTYVLLMEEGEEIVAGLGAFARGAGLEAASFTAIGAISTATLGYFDPEIRKYGGIPVTQRSEIVSLRGVITSGDTCDDAASLRTVHADMVVAGPDGSTRGGHLIEAYVLPMLEVVITESPSHLRRSYDPRTGRALVDLSHVTEPSPITIGCSDGADRP
jgi:uncharacterized protein